MEHRGASVIVLVFIVASVSGKTTSRIAGGNETEVKYVPYQASIVKTGTTELLCGGVLISPYLVLTSAFCASRSSGFNTQVMVGNNKLITNSPSQFVDVQDKKIHEEYDPENRKNDIALLKLRNEVKIDQSAVNTIKIRQSDFPATATCTLSGWETTAWNGSSPRVLQRSELSVVDYVICTWILKEKIEASQFCAEGKEGENACFLDEGNPLVCNGELAGIMSRYADCSANNRPSVYTEVYKYSDWIEQTKESLGSAAVSTLSSFVTLAMPVGLLSYWKCIE